MRISLDELDSYKGVKLLSSLLTEHLRSHKGETIKGLVKRAGLTPRTVSRIISRDTMSPRLLTVILLFKALGFVAMRLE